jgi:hypothetical protein
MLVEGIAQGYFYLIRFRLRASQHQQIISVTDQHRSRRQSGGDV